MTEKGSHMEATSLSGWVQEIIEEKDSAENIASEALGDIDDLEYRMTIEAKNLHIIAKSWFGSGQGQIVAVAMRLENTAAHVANRRREQDLARGNVTGEGGSPEPVPLMSRITILENALTGLRKDLLEMLPRNFNTMSAVRHRDITEFVLREIDRAMKVE